MDGRSKYDPPSCRCAGNAQISVAFTAPPDYSGPAITGYTATCGAASQSGTSSPIVVTGLTNGVDYTCTVTATNAIGTSATSAASNSVTPTAPQTITFANPGTQTFGTSPTLTASASSGLTASFSSLTTGVCTITTSGTLTFLAIGTCDISAEQAGNGAYTAAPTITQSFAVNATVPGAPTIGTATAGNTQATVTFTAPGSDGGSAITTYTATSNPSGVTGTCANSPCTVTGLANGTAYTFTVTAANAAGSGAASVASNSVTPKAPQTINFANPGTQIFGTSPTLTATATSGLAVSFSSSTTGVCTITTGGTLTFLAIDNCDISADQTGNDAYTAAPTVTQSFSIDPPPIAFTGNAYSRKAHGIGIGVQDLPLFDATINDAFTVEPRVAGSGHQIVFRFTSAVTSVTGVSITDASAVAVGNPLIGFFGNDLVLTLSGIGDMTRVTVSVTGVNGIGGLDVSRAVGFLVGDMNGSHVVTAADIAGIKSRKGITIDNSNFKFDVNLSGAIDDADVSVVKVRAGQVLP